MERIGCKLTSVITGASSGIGAGIAKHLLKSNQNVALIALPKEISKLEHIVSTHYNFNSNDSSFKIVCADLTKSDECLDAYNEINEWLNIINNNNNKNSNYNNNGALHSLFNCCGAASKLTINLENCSIEEWNYHLNVNLTSAFLMSKYFIPNLTIGALKTNNGDASIINMGSIFGKQPFPGTLPYNISKAGIHHLTKSCALELSEKNIRVNAICPSAIETSFHTNAGLTKQEANEYYSNIGQLHYSADRVGTVEDVVQMMLFLTDKNKAKFITGQCIDLDAGRRLTPPMLHGAKKMDKPKKVEN